MHTSRGKSNWKSVVKILLCLGLIDWVLFLLNFEHFIFFVVPVFFIVYCLLKVLSRVSRKLLWGSEQKYDSRKNLIVKTATIISLFIIARVLTIHFNEQYVNILKVLYLYWIISSYVCLALWMNLDFYLNQQNEKLIRIIIVIFKKVLFFKDNFTLFLNYINNFFKRKIDHQELLKFRVIQPQKSKLIKLNQTVYGDQF
ncbi:hypothetical protein SCLARK_00454 [Spiroplasma clarkii]|uniref:Transmembrane protein n=1 Tax=Spiroplasma clarkii TaxID=2139 RepID=A0A1Y0L068_9MOLU|nr:hypothetical protein [Spiroplasma clarkii]ARU91170.1 hypothetical protein SCLARK_00454 [Spiroplasma clarkii]ATX70610.1 hypothetical protein SCLAR_v1c02800 [Spiroplasma clarkii]